MAVSVQADCRTGCIHRLHLLPEIRVRLIDLQLGIAVVGNYGENRSDTELLNHRQKALPPLARHGGTEIVKAKQVLCRLHDHEAASVRSLGMSRQVQYQRKRNVLSVHSDVASAIPATPNQRIRIRFSTTSST